MKDELFELLGKKIGAGAVSSAAKDRPAVWNGEPAPTQNDVDPRAIFDAERFTREPRYAKWAMDRSKGKSLVEAVKEADAAELRKVAQEKAREAAAARAERRKAKAADAQAVGDARRQAAEKADLEAWDRARG